MSFQRLSERVEGKSHCTTSVRVRGEIPPKTPLLQAWIGIFKLNWQNIESFTLSKLLHWFQCTADLVQVSNCVITIGQVVIGGGPSKRPTNPRRQMAGILKTIKLPYLCNCLTDFDEIWHGGAHWSPDHTNIWQSYMADSRNLENKKKLLKYIL